MNGTNQQTINISFNQLIVTFVASMLIAASCVAFITNMIINNKVNALTQKNPVTSNAAEQTNNAPGLCVGTATPQTNEAENSSTVSAGRGGAGFSVGSLTSGKLLAGNYSFSYSNNQTNISNTTNTSTNTAIDSRYSGNTLSISALNGNTVNSNSGNTTNTSTTRNTVTNTVTRVVSNTVTNSYTDNSNSSVNNSGNTSNTSNTSNTNNDNSNRSIDIRDNVVAVLP